MCNQPAFFRAVYAGRLTEEDALVLVHARVRKQQRRVVVGHDRGTRPVRVRVALEVLDEGASYFLLGPALGRVRDALSEAHRPGLGLKLRRHRRQRCLVGDERAAVVDQTAPRLASARRIGLVCRNRLRRLSGTRFS